MSHSLQPVLFFHRASSCFLGQTVHGFDCIQIASWMVFKVGEVIWCVKSMRRRTLKAYSRDDDDLPFQHKLFGPELRLRSTTRAGRSPLSVWLISQFFEDRSLQWSGSLFCLKWTEISYNPGWVIGFIPFIQCWLIFTCSLFLVIKFSWCYWPKDSGKITLVKL